MYLSTCICVYVCVCTHTYMIQNYSFRNELQPYSFLQTSDDFILSLMSDRMFPTQGRMTYKLNQVSHLKKFILIHDCKLLTLSSVFIGKHIVGNFPVFQTVRRPDVRDRRLIIDVVIFLVPKRPSSPGTQKEKVSQDMDRLLKFVNINSENQIWRRGYYQRVWFPNNVFRY